MCDPFFLMNAQEALALLQELQRAMNDLQSARYLMARQDPAFQAFLRIALHRYVPR